MVRQISCGLAGMGNNVYDDRIYQEMLGYRRFPEELFTASAAWMERLRAALARDRISNKGSAVGE